MNIHENINRIKQIMGFGGPRKENSFNDEKTKFTCQDCGNYDYKMFMVNDDLWKEYGNDKLTLCKSCFEKRLGRKITKDDISQHKDALANIYNPELKDLY